MMASTQFSLRTVWIAHNAAKRFFHSDIKNPDQTSRMRKLSGVLILRTCQKVRSHVATATASCDVFRIIFVNRN